jgi:hypothetical protein
MRLSDIRRHLTPYSIAERRSTTISHAFASALAPCDTYDEGIAREAMASLGQDPDEALRCVYCDGAAETWDHLVGLVKKSVLHGFGHQLGNLVPCCKPCNSKKGNKEWRQFLEQATMESTKRDLLTSRLATYQAKYAEALNLSALETTSPEDWAEYTELRKEIVRLMKKADGVAQRLRQKLARGAA